MTLYTGAVPKKKLTDIKIKLDLKSGIKIRFNQKSGTRPGSRSEKIIFKPPFFSLHISVWVRFDF